MKKVIFIFISLVLFSYVTVPIFAKQAEPTKNLKKTQTIQKLKNLSKNKLKLSEKDGQLFLSGKLSSKHVKGQKSATKFLDENKHRLTRVTGTSKKKGIRKDNKDGISDAK